jgi:hypothetical protein
VINSGAAIAECDRIVAATRRWLEKSVIGLGLCPFAESVYRSDRVRFRVSEQRSSPGLLEELRTELRLLRAEDPARCETTLLIHPWVLADFMQYNDFLAVCDATIADLGMEGELQIASFHPLYRFAGTRPDDVENCTNRSPYPMLHILREASVERAVAGGARADDICDKNIRTLRDLGHAGWGRLWDE